MNLSLVLLVLSCCCVMAQGQELVVLIEPTEVMGFQGETVNITCVVGPDEPTSTQLLTDNNQLLPSTLLTVTGNRVVFSYGPLVPADNGRVVICRYAGLTATGSITVFSPPVYSVETSVVSAPLGEALTLSVVVTGNPVPSDQQTLWKLGGSPLPPGVVASFNTLQFSSLELFHDGLYSVSSTTTAGQSNNLTIQLNVLYPPVFRDMAGIGVVCSNNSCALHAGDPGSFYCAPEGNPPPTLTILSPDPLISDDLSNGLITIDSAASPGLHIITCSASNTQGSVTRTITLLVGGIPVQPGLVVVNVQEEFLVVSWSQEEPESVDNYQFIVRGVVEGEPLVQGTLPPFTRSYTHSLRGLEGGQQFDFELTAVNLLGESPTAGTRFITPLGSNGSSGVVMSGRGLLSLTALAVLLIFV